MKEKQRKTVNVILISLLAVISLAACLLFAQLPTRSLDTEIVYQGF
jgi:hypothetical protein